MNTPVEPNDLRSRLSVNGGAWRDLLDELKARPDLPAIREQLEQISESDAVFEVRYRARKFVSLLSGIHKRPAVVASAPPALGTLPASLAGLTAKERVRRIEQYCQMHPQSAGQDLVPLLTSEPDPMVLSAVLRLLGKAGAAVHVPDVKPFLSHSNPRVVANAVEAVGRLDAGSAPMIVMPLLMAEDHRVRANVLMVLYGSSPEEVLDYLSRMATSSKESFRAAAIWCLSQIKDPDGGEILVSLLAVEDSPELKDTASRLLCETGTVKSITSLKRLATNVPARAAMADPIIQAIAHRLNLSGPALADALGAAKTPPTADGAPPQRANSRSGSGPAGLVVQGRPDPASRVRWWVPVGMVTAMICCVIGLRMHRATPKITAIPEVAQRNPILRSTPRKSSGPKKGSPLIGHVASRSGTVLVIRNGYTNYAVRFRNARILAAIQTGQTVKITARFRSWNRREGFVEMEGLSAPVLQ